jgi:predicted DNA-binding antitoxin AbrB/MazE fold protein
MTKTIQAVYAGGVFKPSEPVAIADGTSVELTVRAEVPEAPVPADVTRNALLEIASMPLEGPDDGFSGADHDKVLYGGVDEDGHVDAR